MTAQAIEFDKVDAFLRDVRPAHQDVENVGDRIGLADLVERFTALPTPRGSVVMVSMPNGIRLLRVFFALVLAGHVPVLLSPSMPARRLGEVARKFGAYALVTGRVRPVDHPGSEVGRLGEAELVVFGHQAHQPHEPGHVILMTSGTSGFASGCLHSVAALLRNARRHADSIGLTGADTVLVNLPIFYSFGLVAQVLGTLVTGARLVVARPPFSPADYAATLGRHGVTVSSLTPILAKAISGDPLPSPLRTLTIGGQSLAPAHVGTLVRDNPGLGVYLTYGLTEAGPRVSTLAAHREPPSRYPSVGRPLDGVRIRLRDNGSGEQEVLVRADTVYRRRVGEVSAAKRGTLLGPDLVATGDIGYLDEDGYLFIRGRSSEFTVIRGEKVCLASVRQAAESLPGVVRAVARSGAAGPDSTDETGGLELDVYVDDTAVPPEQAIRAQLRSMLAPSERPRTLRVHPLPAGEFHK